jgi:uncharacterized membrane protein
MAWRWRNPWHPLRRRAGRHAIAAAVKAAEATTSVEIVVVVREFCEASLNWCEDRDERLLRQAQVEFILNGADRTQEGTGVVILVALQERGFAVWAGQQILDEFDRAFLQVLASDLHERFEEGSFVQGLCEVVAAVSRKVSTKFPRRENDTNELCNQPRVG